MLDDLFLLLSLFSFLGLFVGLVKPSLVLRWFPEEKKTRKNAFLACGASTIVFFILFGLTTPTVTEEAAPNVEGNQVVSTEVATTDEKAETEAEKAKAEEQAKKEEEEKAQKEAEEQAKKEAEEKAKKEAEEAAAKAEAEEKAKENALTMSQKQAVRAAENYLSFTAFSRKGLIEQLEFEGYDNSDATYAVDSLNVDWQEQAIKKAEDYLDLTAFSKSGLVDQLMFEGFSKEHATNAANTVYSK